MLRKVGWEALHNLVFWTVVSLPVLAAAYFG